MGAPAGTINAFLALDHDQFSRGMRQAEKETLTFTRGLQVQAATYGRSAREVKLYELQMRGASAATIAQAKAVEQHVAMLERQRAATAQRDIADADGGAFIAQLRQQIATLGMTSREVKLYELQMRGAMKGTLEAATALEKTLAALERKRAATIEAAAAEQQLQQQADQLVASLKLQADTFGMTARQAQIYAMEQRGASAATIAQARAIDQQLGLLEQQRAREQAAAAAAKQLATDSHHLVSSLRIEAATFGMSSRQARIYEMQMRGASAATLADARALDRHITALERDRAAQARAGAARREFLSAAGFGRTSMLLGGGASAAGVVAGAAIAATAAIAAMGVAGSVVAMKMAADFEQVQVAFRVIIGDARAADAVLKDIRQFANATPFEFPELAGGAKQLAAYGIEAQQLVPTLRMLGELAAGLNIPIGELADLYGRNRAQQRLYTRDLNEFMGRGIPLLDEFAKMFGTTTPQIKAMVEDGQIYFGHLQQALIDLTDAGGRFAGLTEAQSQTVIGRWSTLKDAVTEFAREIGEILNDELAVADNLDRLATVFEIIGEGARVAKPWVSALMDALARPKQDAGWIASFFIGANALTGVVDAHLERFNRYQDAKDKNKVKPDDVPDFAAQAREAAAAKEDERLATEGQRIHDEMRTPQEKYAAELERITMLLEAEKIGIADYTRARDNAKKEYEESDPAFKERQKAEQDAQRKAKQAQEQQDREAKALIEGMRTPQEAFEALIADYERLLNVGAIDWSTFDRARAAAAADLAGGGKKGEKTFAGAAEIGSSEWYAALIRGSSDNLAKETLKVERDALKETQKIVTELERVSVPLTVELL